MGNHWVRATKPLSRHALTGAYVTYQPGDWFEVKNQERTAFGARDDDATGNPCGVRSDALLLVRTARKARAARTSEYGIRVVETHALTLTRARGVHTWGARYGADDALGLARGSTTA